MINDFIYTVIEMTIIPYILNGGSRTKETTKELFYFFTIIRKLAVNIGGYLPKSDSTKIGVTEKSYDFVTFSHSNKTIFTGYPIYSDPLKNKNSIAYKLLYWILAE
ncbi:hypothetical protein C6497_03255 [Candidatus Poribacteria bacterium]|nr:MAG: hypothetical protein C6497_03255 [Candidatus Poribacteria bacterium]